MAEKVPSATAIINAHREGALIVPTLRSLGRARDRAAAAGFRVEFLIVADRPDARTLEILAEFDNMGGRLDIVDYGNLSLSREHGINAAKTDYLFLHDGDDLYSSNWYSAFAEQFAAGGVDENTVYHTRLFARFGALFDIYKTPDSTSLSFDPHSLILDWYFSNKCVFHRSLVERFPIPPIDRDKGVGNEDWSWSADTIAAGVRHTYLPNTTCFYRVKPSHLSLGAVKGTMQGRSALFDHSYILEKRKQQNEARLSRLRPNEGLDMTALPSWPAETLGSVFVEELAIQAEFEPLLTKFIPVTFSDTAVKEKKQYPIASRFYRRVARCLDRATLNVIWLPKALPYPLDHMLDWISEGLELSGPTGGKAGLLVFFEQLDDPDTIIELDRWEGVGINIARLDASGMYDDYQKSRFFMRFLMQNSIENTVDFGSASLNRMVSEFPAAYRNVCGKHVGVLPHRYVDWFDPAMASVIVTAHALARPQRVPIICFSEEVACKLGSASMKLIAEGELLLREADRLSATRLSSHHGVTLSRTRATAVISRMLSAARDPLPLGSDAAPAPMIQQRGDVVDIQGPRTLTNQHFRNAGPWLLERYGSADIVIPSNLFFRIDGRDYAMWLPHERPAESLARFIDVAAESGATDIPLSLTVRSSCTDVIEQITDVGSALEAYLRVATDFADRVIVAQESVAYFDGEGPR